VVKTVIKKEGATQTCGKCGTDIICRLKEYGGNFAPTLQWQNYDGTAHFKTTDGKTYVCNVPNDDETAQARIPSQVTPPATTPGLSPQPVWGPEIPPPSVNLSVINTLDEIKLILQRMDEMIQAIFRYTVDEQLKKK
jgi:hypothetical protein